MFKLRSLVFTTALAVFVAGCGGDDPTGIGDELSEEELAAVFAIFGQAFAGMQPTPGLSGPAAISYSQNLAGTVECGVTGSVSDTASLDVVIDDVTQASDFAYVATITPDNCGVSTPNGTVTVDGNPNLQITVDAMSDSSGGSTSGTWAGGFSFTTAGGQSGSCSMNVNFSSSYTVGSTVTSSVSGTACGISADSFTTLSVGMG